jgi:hypothetical protein
MNIIHGGGFTVRRLRRDLGEFWLVAIELNAETYEVISNPFSNFWTATEVKGRAGHVILKFGAGFNTPAFVQFRWLDGLWYSTAPIQLAPPTGAVQTHEAAGVLRITFVEAPFAPVGYRAVVHNDTQATVFNVFGLHSPIETTLIAAAGNFIRSVVVTEGTEGVDSNYLSSEEAPMDSIIW